MDRQQHRNVALLQQLKVLTAELGGFDTNFGLCNSNYTKFTPFLFEISIKSEELRAIRQALKAHGLDFVSDTILEYSHAFYSTSDFMHAVVSFFNEKPGLIPEQMTDYHENPEHIQLKKQLANIESEWNGSAHLLGIRTSYAEMKNSFSDCSLLELLTEGKRNLMEKAREKAITMELEKELNDPAFDMQAACALHFGVDGYYAAMKTFRSDFKILKMMRYPDTRKESKEPRNVNILLDFIDKMEKSENKLHFPLKFRYFGCHEVMHRMVTDHEDIILHQPEFIRDPEDGDNYHKFVKKVNQLKQIVEFMQRQTFNTKIYSIPFPQDLMDGGYYWENASGKYYGTVFIVGESASGNLIGFWFDQSISI